MFEFLRRSSPLWRHAPFNRLWAAQALSAFGNRITRTAIPIIAVSVLPRLVGKEQLVEANSRLQSTESIAELTGPGAAGVLIDLLTAPVAIIADALTFLWSAFWLFRIPKEAGQPAEEAKPDTPA